MHKISPCTGIFPRSQMGCGSGNMPKVRIFAAEAGENGINSGLMMHTKPRCSASRDSSTGTLNRQTSISDTSSPCPIHGDRLWKSAQANAPHLSTCSRPNCVACTAKKQRAAQTASKKENRLPGSHKSLGNFLSDSQKSLPSTPKSAAGRDGLEARVRELEAQVERYRLEQAVMAGEGSGDFKGALKELDAARRRASENQELAQATIRDLKEKNMWLEAGFAEERARADTANEALERAREDASSLQQRVSELEGELRGLREGGSGTLEMRVVELEEELRGLKDEGLEARLRDAEQRALRAEEGAVAELDARLREAEERAAMSKGAIGDTSKGEIERLHASVAAAEAASRKADDGMKTAESRMRELVGELERSQRRRAELEDELRKATSASENGSREIGLKFEEAARTHERAVRTLEDRVREAERSRRETDERVVASSEARKELEESRRALMWKTEDLEQALATAKEEAEAGKRALVAAERRGGELSVRLREAEEREAATHAEQRMAVMTEAKQQELLDRASAAESEASASRARAAASERAFQKDKKEMEERYTRLEADLVSRHESARRVDKEAMLRVEAECERLRSEGGAEVRAKLQKTEAEAEGLKEQVRSMRAAMEKRSEEARRERQQRLEAEGKPGVVDIVDLERRLAAAERDAVAADKEVEASRERQLRAAQVVREGRVRLDQTLVKLEHSNRTCKMLKEEAQAASKKLKASRDEVDHLEMVLVHATEVMARKGGSGGVKHAKVGYWAEQSRQLGERMADGVHRVEEDDIMGSDVDDLLEREEEMRARESTVLDELMGGAGFRGAYRGATVRDSATAWMGEGAGMVRGARQGRASRGYTTAQDASDDWIGLGGGTIGV